MLGAPHLSVARGTGHVACGIMHGVGPTPLLPTSELDTRRCSSHTVSHMLLPLDHVSMPQSVHVCDAETRILSMGFLYPGAS